MKRIALPAVLLMGVFTLGACADTPVDPVSSSVEGSIEALYSRAPAPGPKTIAEIVVASTVAVEPEFTLLLAAIGYIAETNPGSALIAGLFDNDQYTVFAPTDQAFLDLVALTGVSAETPFADIDALLGPGTVEAVVSYHVVEGRRAANSVVPPVRPRTITTLLGATFTVDRNGVITDIAGQKVKIVAADISASNGIIHVIDTVLLPLPPD